MHTLLSLFFFFKLLILYDPQFHASAATHSHSCTLDLSIPNCSSAERVVSDLHREHNCPLPRPSPHFSKLSGASNLLTPLSSSLSAITCPHCSLYLFCTPGSITFTTPLFHCPLGAPDWQCTQLPTLPMPTPRSDTCCNDCAWRH